jgi:ketosteroid isomerase-like protein
LNRFLMTLLCSAAAACGGTAVDPSFSTRSASAAKPSDGRAAALAALFAADAAHTASIAQLGPVDGLVRAMRGNALYLAADIDVVQGKSGIRAAVAAAEPDAAHTSLKRTLAGGDVSADGRFGFTFGWLEKTRPASDGTTLTSYGTYVSTWARDDDAFRVTAYYTRVSLTPHLPTRDGFPLLLGGAGAGAVSRPGSVEQHRRALLQTDAEFAAYSVAHGFSASFPAFSADIAMPFGRNFFFLIGNQEVTDFYAGSPPEEVVDWTPVFAGASESGDLGFTVGKVIDSITNPDGSVDRFYSKYLTIWARQASGSWRFIADGGAASPPPSP